jgi:hypothetical protein
VSATLRISLGELALTGEGLLMLLDRAAWWASVELTSKAAPAVGEPATLAIAGEAKLGAPPPVPDVFSGVVRHARAVPGSATLAVRIVGGAGRLFATLPPADQVGGAAGLPAGLVLRAIVDAAGERLAPGVEDALDAYALPRWTRIGGMSARDAVDLLVADVAAAEGVALGWRMLADGSIWAGVDTWPEAPGTYVYTDQQPDDGVMIYAPSGAPLRPGQSVQGERAVEVVYQLSSPSVRALVRHAVPGDPPMEPAIDARAPYLGSYVGTVEVSTVAGIVDVICDDARLGELRGVPYRLGVPGSAATLARGHRVRVRFEDGSPRGAYACDADAVLAATHPLALVGDACGYLSGTAPAGGGPVALSWSATRTGAPGEVAISVVGPGHRYVKGESA